MASGNLGIPDFSESFEGDETTTLCELCNSIIFHSTEIGSEIEVILGSKLSEEEIPTMLLILNGVNEGCRFCTVVWRAFRDEEVYRNFSSNNNTNALYLTDIVKRFVISSLSLELEEGISVGYYRLSYKTTYEKTNWKGGGVLVLVLDTSNGYQDFHKASQPLTNNNHLSEERWRNFCYSSIRMCQENHELCNSVSISEKASRSLPTRLIDVKCDPPRLILSSNVEPASSYATLSHCWGKAPILTLTTKNLEVFQQGLPISQLSKTFQETIDDFKPDWENEAPKMSQVYGNAFCCIAASSATDGSKGLFYPRNSVVDDIILINLDRAKHPRLPSPVRITILNKEKWLQIIREAPLNQRGWVVQKMALTKRTLQFFDGEVMWKCQKIMASESFSVISSCLKISDDRLLFPHSLTANLAFRIFWSQLLQMYSKTILSYPDDILMAMAGVARQFGEYLPTKNRVYLAGMWSFELERQLGWLATMPGSRHDLDRRECPSSNVVPSWSWASSKGRSIVNAWDNGPYNKASTRWYDWTPAEYKRHMILYLNRIYPPQFTIIDVETKIASKDSFGPVTPGFLRLRGQLNAGRHSFTSLKENVATWNNKNLPFVQVLGRSSPKLFPMVFDRSQSDGDLREIREGILFVSPLNFENARVSTALILRPSCTRKSFVRVGCALNVAKNIAFDSESSKLIGEEFYEESHGNGEYTIRII